MKLVVALVVASFGAVGANAAAEGPQTATPPAEGARDKDHHSHPTTHEPAKAGEKAVEQGIFPNSIHIPGTDLSFSLGGYAKVDVIQDFDAIGNAAEFQTSSIPVEGSPAAAEGGRTTIQAIETRFNLDLRSKDKFRAFVEGDFFGSGSM